MDAQGQSGLMSTYRQAWRSRGAFAWALAGVLFAFYVVLYFTEWLTPAAVVLGLRNKWYLYGALYTVVMAGGAVWFLRQHGSSRYQRVRTLVNLGVQTFVAFLLPFVMEVLGHKAYYFSYLWPLKIEYFYPREILSHPILVVVYSFAGSLLLVPALTLWFGKRWYCSWVCGCGALANTFGDPWRHLSSKSTKAWRFEKVSIHTMLVLTIAATLVVGVNWAIGEQHPGFSAFAFRVQGAYGFVVGFVLAAAVGVGLYPIFGTRVWCRFACPMAALLGLIQKLGRFHIRVKKDMCISCGNCSAYCEMGIDVRSYAQRNESFTRASCVGCGVCAHVCPRGVLKLEHRSRIGGNRPRQGLPVLEG